MLIVSRCYSNEDNKMYYLPKIKGNKTSVFIIIFTFIMIIPATAIFFDDYYFYQFCLWSAR